MRVETPDPGAIWATCSATSMARPWPPTRWPSRASFRAQLGGILARRPASQHGRECQGAHVRLISGGLGRDVVGPDRLASRSAKTTDDQATARASAMSRAWPSIPAMTAASEAFGERPAVVDHGVRLTYSELVRDARRFGAALVASGIERGDRVAIWCFNCAEWIVAALGQWEVGATLVPINTRLKGNEAAEILARTKARALVTVTDFLGTDYVAMLDGSGVALPALDTVVVARGKTPATALSWDDFLSRAND